MQISLNGNWDLYYFPQGEKDIKTPQQLKSAKLQPIEAIVPGNVELDLMRAGVLPDVYIGANIRALKEYETYEWWYETSFETPAIHVGRQAELVFHGVDCFATYWLDGQEIGESANMLIEHRMDISSIIKSGQTHVLTIRLRSPIIEALGMPFEPSTHALPVNFESLWTRKAGHMFGWDIFPRAISFGLWRSVELAVKEPIELEEIYIATLEADEEQARMRVTFRINTDLATLEALELRLTGVCGDAQFTVVHKPRFVYGNFEFEIDRPLLWWPRGYGEANLYELKLELLHQNSSVYTRIEQLGVRTVELLRSDITWNGSPGQFLFKVNDTPIMVKGTNWVPLDIFHSKDAAKYESAMELCVDLNCNMLRSWGGNVYEDHAFFDLCDKHGVMVWQDFAMACALYPQEQAFQDIMRKEATQIVRKLRNHASLVIWCGDNEVDEFSIREKIDPNRNLLTRKVLQEVVYQCDPYRPYMASSPYISPEAFKSGDVDMMPERHLWGPRDYFKSSYYSTAKPHFVGEMGYHGCPSLTSIRKFIDPEFVWPWQDNEQWIIHGTDPIGGLDSRFRFRVKLMADQILELFGEIPDNQADFILASQISQAEAKKFFIEYVRLRQGLTNGILWWNMLDGWPQFSDAVVDYYGVKKLAYHYIKRVQQPICIIVDEPENWNVQVKIVNDSNLAEQGNYRVWDAADNVTLLEGSFEVKAGSIRTLGAIRAPRSAQRILLIEWTIGGKQYGNHYMLGSPAFSLQQYKAALSPIASLPFNFNAAEIGS